jgi:hypothetical protein
VFTQSWMMILVWEMLTSAPGALVKETNIVIFALKAV